MRVNDEQRTEVRNEHPWSQPTGTTSKDTQGQNGQASHNHTDGSTRDTIESNVGNVANINLDKNRHNTANNNINVQQTSEYRSKNLQNHPQLNTQQNANTPPYTVQSQN